MQSVATSGRSFGGNWEADRRKRDNAAKRRAADLADAKRVDALGRQRAVDLAQAHRHENGFFESVASQVDAGGSVSPKQAAMLLKIATEQGWSTKATSKGAAVAKTTQGKIEMELRDNAELLGYAERCRSGEVLSHRERGRANWLMGQEGLR